MNPAPAALLAEQPEVVFHDSQPMVVDLSIKLRRPGSAVLTLSDDSGARPALPESEPGTDLTLRVRGLLPDRDYHGTLVLTGQSGGERSVAIDFHTLPPLPGFIPSFPVTSNGKPSNEYRIFDLSTEPYMTENAIFAVGPDGRTRFFLPHPAKTTVIPAVPAGIKLLDDGTLLFVQDNVAYQLDELGNVVWQVAAGDLGMPGFSHDIIELPDGHFMTMSYAFKNVYLDADQKTHHVVGDLLVEFDRQGHKLWTWNAFDHLDAQRVRPGFDELIMDPATGEMANDWTHGNAIIYRPADDSILLSVRHQDWLIKIDHKSGNIVWRLGDGGDFNLTAGSWFWHQHAPEWESDGSLLVYDNGLDNPEVQLSDMRSRPLQIALDETAMTARVVWQDTKKKYLSPIAGDVDRLDNGHVDVLDSAIPLPTDDLLSGYARIREIDRKTDQWVWTMRLPDNHMAYRCIASHRLPGEAKQ